MEIDIEKSCSFTGHRIIKNDFNLQKFDDLLESLINDGYNTFLIGMAIGFDTLAFERLLLKKEKNIKIIACIPCREQDKFFNKKEKEKYKYLLEKADEKIFFSEEYDDGCMFVRNRFMVDNSSTLIAYFYKKIGGTYYTINYAEKKRKNIIYI